MIHLDTSVLIDAFTGARASAGTLKRTIEQGEPMTVSSLVLYEWLRGPRLEGEVADQEALFPSARSVRFGAKEADVAAVLYRAVSHPRGRDIDLAIAACALTHGAMLWTSNPDDFRDIPGLMLFAPPGA